MKIIARARACTFDRLAGCADERSSEKAPHSKCERVCNGSPEMVSTRNGSDQNGIWFTSSARTLRDHSEEVHTLMYIMYINLV